MNKMEDLIALLFLSREVSHRAHLAAKGTGSFALHLALEEFYNEIVDMADELAEQWQGENGLFEDGIPILDTQYDGTIQQVLWRHKRMIEQVRYKIVPKDDTCTQNLIDEIIKRFRRTNYKLVNLK